MEIRDVLLVFSTDIPFPNVFIETTNQQSLDQYLVGLETVGQKNCFALKVPFPVQMHLLVEKANTEFSSAWGTKRFGEAPSPSYDGQ